MQSRNDNKGFGTGKVKGRQVSNMGRIWNLCGFPTLVVAVAILLIIQFSGSEATQSELGTQSQSKPSSQVEQSITIPNPDQEAEFDPAGIPASVEPRILSRREEDTSTPREGNSIKSGPPTDELLRNLEDIPLPEDSRIGQSLATYNLTNGLVLWMHFNNDSGVGEDYNGTSDTVYDYSGNGNNGTV